MPSNIRDCHIKGRKTKTPFNVESSISPALTLLPLTRMENTPRRAERSMNVKTVAWCKYFLAELRSPQFQEEIFTITCLSELLATSTLYFIFFYLFLVFEDARRSWNINVNGPFVLAFPRGKRLKWNYKFVIRHWYKEWTWTAFNFVTWQWFEQRTDPFKFSTSDATTDLPWSVVSS